MPCCYSHQISDQIKICQFHTREHELHEWMGKKWCAFHLPLMDEYGKFTEKQVYPPNTVEKFNQAVFDYIDAHINDDKINLSGVVFPGPIDFSRYKYLPALDLTNAVFKNSVSFKKVCFNGIVNFRGTRFHGAVSFFASRFKDYVSFNDTQFLAGQNFNNTEFYNASFRAMTVTGCSLFLGSIFAGSCYFSDATFKSDAHFSHSHFHENVYLSDVRFHGSVYMNRCRFLKDLYARGAWFCSQNSLSGDAVFDQSYFGGLTCFVRANFFVLASFKGAEFRDAINFDYGEFDKGIDFVGDGITVHRIKSLRCVNAYLFEDIRLGNCQISHSVNFNNCQFYRAPDFTNVDFPKRTEFHNAKFFDLQSENSRSLYKTLRYKIQTTHAHKEQMKLFALEQKCLQKKQYTSFKSIWSRLYGWTSDFGQDLQKTTWLFIIINYLYILLYFYIIERDESFATQFAFKQIILPFMVWLDQSLTANAEGFALFVKLLASSQSMVSGVLLAIIIFASHWRLRQWL